MKKEVTEVVESAIGESDLSRQDRLAQLRNRMASIPAGGDGKAVLSFPTGASVGVPVDRAAKAGILPVPAGIAELLPQGGLVRGTVVSVEGAASLLVGLMASVTASGGHVAVIGQPRLGVLAAYEMGAKLERLAFIPAPGPDPVEVAAVLLDGMDLVILGLAGASVPPSRARAVVARARSKGSTLVVTDGHWDGAEIRLDARVEGYGGFGQGRALGRGRLESLSLAVRARGRSFQPRTTRLDICSAAGHVEWRPTREVSAAQVVAL
ncbi:hypothetical protein [Rhodococcus sp. IEGM 1379]|uniref:hypothetical protein n=1 Tax=Rhodococcus sp. IEGM 1379 TaxID=3047086 RepID=UPI0024B74F75|nr:hypothetical protein [Rhodococcus sp. IEGM 1379]MDI9914705.1 hypothetical protein [Rhodococcus sp. IEGM 1379]